MITAYFGERLDPSAVKEAFTPASILRRTSPASSQVMETW